MYDSTLFRLARFVALVICIAIAASVVVGCANGTPRYQPAPEQRFVEGRLLARVTYLREVHVLRILEDSVITEVPVSRSMYLKWPIDTMLSIPLTCDLLTQ